MTEDQNKTAPDVHATGSTQRGAPSQPGEPVIVIDHSRIRSLAGGIAAALFAFVLVTSVMMIIISDILVRNRAYATWVTVVSIAVGALCAWVFGKGMYRSYRYRVILPEDRNCIVCKYDLTGNVSGRCPECGSAIPGWEASEDRPWKGQRS